MSEYIRAVKIDTDSSFVDTDMPNTLEAFQEAVDGYIETIYIGCGITLICNEEGILRKLPENYRAGKICGERNVPTRIFGNVVFVGNNGSDEFVSLTDLQALLLERI